MVVKKGKLFPVNATKKYGGWGGGVHLHSFLTSALDMVGRQRNNPAHLPPSPRYPINWKLDGRKRRSGRFGEQEISYPYRD